MSIDDLLTDLRRDERFMANVATWRTIHAQPARFAPMPAGLHPALQARLAGRGVAQLYSHQARAVELALGGDNVAVVTPTASGKTLCYNLPILQSLLTDPDARALYLFPTKALAQDQLAELQSWRADLAAAGHPGLDASTYDGDTPSGRRAQIRRSSRLILTNPDMLHTGILPYHTNWAAFLGGLRYVVIDEMHTYRGVFGSHVANVLRRLLRLCGIYGAAPRFICTSATIANPQELAQRLIEAPVTLVDENGAPRGQKEIILYNPPIYDAERGLRRSSVLETQELAARSILAGVQTIVFSRARMTTELLLSYIRERIARMPRRRNSAETAGDAGHDQTWQRLNAETARAQIHGYRGGYLPLERRAIEAGLRSGAVRGVVATNALELGIDIGQLQAAILCGYPGSIAGAWQQMGRAGRTTESSLALLVATGGVLDQYVIQHPEFLFGSTPEHALIHPDNLMLLVDHVRCAAFEQPFQPGEPFGGCVFTSDVLQLLCEQGEVQQAGQRYLWSGAGYPAQQVSLRSAGSDTVAVQARTPDGPLVVGQVDQASATFLVHDGAVYMHEGDSYVVERLDQEEQVAHVRRADLDYYTDPSIETQIDVLTVHQARIAGGAQIAHGDLLVQSQVVGYRRIKRFTHETLGVHPLSYAPDLLETNGYWLTATPEAQLRLAQAGHWHDSVNDYGPNWQEARSKVRARDGYRCTQCGTPEPRDRQHDVHHLVPFRTFGYVAGVNDAYRVANRLENLVLVCRTCHRRLEAGVRVRTGLDGLAYVLANLAPLHLMCDRSDLGMAVIRGEEKREGGEGNGDSESKIGKEAGKTQEPEKSPAPRASAIYLFERVAAGLGFSSRLFEIHDQLLDAAHALVQGCGCRHGCPACVGPVLEGEQVRLETKALTQALLNVLRNTPAPSGQDTTRQDIHF